MDKALMESNPNARKKAILARGKYENELIKPRYDNEIDIRNLADELLKEYAESSGVWLKDLLIKRMITRRQVMAMQKRSVYFAEAYSLLKDIQESRLFHAGITGAGNIQQIIFALKNVSLWRNEPIENDDNDTHDVVLVPHRQAETDTHN